MTYSNSINAPKTNYKPWKIFFYIYVKLTIFMFMVIQSGKVLTIWRWRGRVKIGQNQENNWDMEEEARRTMSV